MLRNAVTSTPRASVVSAHLLGATLTFVALAAHAEPATTDRVVLDDGREVYGPIREIVPDDHLTLRTLAGKVVTIPWKRIRRIERDVPAPPEASASAASSEPRAPPAPPPPPPAPSASAEPAPSAAPEPPPKRLPRAGAESPSDPTVVVHIESKLPVTLERSEPGKIASGDVCTSPCDKVLPLGGDYRITGVDVRALDRFQLVGKPGDRVVVRVDTASKSGFSAGAVIGGIGGGIAALTLLVIWAQHSNGASSSGSTDGGVVEVFAVSAVAAAVGGAVMLVNWSTSVTQSAKSGAPAAPRDAFRREGVWIGSDVARAMPGAPRVGVVTLSF